MSESSENLEAFSTFLRNLRDYRGFTQAQIEGSRGPSAKTLNAIENGKEWPSALSISKLIDAYTALKYPIAGRTVEAVFNLLAPEEMFEGGCGRLPGRDPAAPRFSTTGTGLTLLDITSDGGPFSEEGVSVARITVDIERKDMLSRPVWPRPAWLRFVDDAMKQARFVFVEHTPGMLALFGPADISHAYLRSTPQAHTSSTERASWDYQQVAIDPTWDCVSSEVARVSLEELLGQGEDVDPWAPMVLMTAVRLARKRVADGAQFDHVPGIKGRKARPGPLSFLMDGGVTVARSLRELLVGQGLLAEGPTDAAVERAARQILEAYNDVIESILGQIDLSATGAPEFSRNAIQRIEDLVGTIWTNPRAMGAARAIASGGHRDYGDGTKRRGLLVSEDAIVAGVWEGSPAYSEPALTGVRLLEPFDDVFIGDYRGARVAFRL